MSNNDDNDYNDVDNSVYEKVFRKLRFTCPNEGRELTEELLRKTLKEVLIEVSIAKLLLKDIYKN
jgi:hypothetical protein